MNPKIDPKSGFPRSSPRQGGGTLGRVGDPPLPVLKTIPGAPSTLFAPRQVHEGLRGHPFVNLTVLPLDAPLAVVQRFDWLVLLPRPHYTREGDGFGSWRGSVLGVVDLS